MGLFLEAPRPVGSAVHYHAVRGGSFVLKCSGTCQTTRVIAGKMHFQSPILKCYGVLSNLVILTNLWQSCIIHTLTEPATNLEFRALQCLKCGGLWSSLGIGRFRCLHSSLMRAIRCANSALNAGVPTDPHSPESNSSYLAWIWSIRELCSLCASCTVIKKTSLGMIRSDKYKFWVSNFNVRDIGDAKTGLISVKYISELRELLIFTTKLVKTG